MIVSTKNFDQVVQLLKNRERITFDVETEGLYPYKNDQLFSIILAIEGVSYYLNFQHYDDVPEHIILPRDWIIKLQPVFDNPEYFAYGHNLKFDMAFLDKEGIVFHRKMLDTKSRARLLFNEHLSYSLSECAKRIGLEKDDTVENFIKAKKLYTIQESEYKTAKEKLLHYDQVPFDLISKYGEQDGFVTNELARKQDLEILKEARIADSMGKKNTILNPAINEMRLTKTIFEMEKKGVLVDVDYCLKARKHYIDIANREMGEFTAMTGKVFVDSGKALREVIDPTLMPKTEGGAPSYAAAALESIKGKHPVADVVLAIRDANKSLAFIESFLHHKGPDGRIHANFNPEGTATGRFSCSNPNLQQLTRDGENIEYNIRKGIVADEGFVFANFDYQAQEFRLVYDLCNAKQMIEKIGSERVDVHQITADIAKVTRQQAKTVGFSCLYGVGINKLSNDLKTTVEEARKIREAVFSAAPELKRFIADAAKAAENQGFVENWFGRKYFFPNKDFAYKATNYLVQGGSSEIMKIALNNMHDYLQGKKSFLSLTVHDSAVVSIHESELEIIPELKQIMIEAYPHQHLPMDVDVKISRSLSADQAV